MSMIEDAYKPKWTVTAVIRFGIVHQTRLAKYTVKSRSLKGAAEMVESKLQKSDVTLLHITAVKQVELNEELR